MKRFNPDENKEIFKNVTVAIPNVSEKVAEEIDKLVHANDKIKAIGLYREHTGKGFADAKNAIEDYMKNIGM